MRIIRTLGLAVFAALLAASGAFAQPTQRSGEISPTTRARIVELLGYTPAPIGAYAYQGAWDANANTPTLSTCDVDRQGFVYRVTTAGATALSGISSWTIGDHAACNGTVWEKWEGVLTQAEAFAAIGYTPANKAGDTFTGAVAAPTIALGGCAIGSHAICTTGTINSSSYIFGTNFFVSTGADGAFNVGGLTLKRSANPALGWHPTNATGAPDALITSPAAANIRLGGVDAAAPVGQTLSVQGGAGTNIAGADFTFALSTSTGNVNGGNWSITGTKAGSSGAVANTPFTIGKFWAYNPAFDGSGTETYGFSTGGYIAAAAFTGSGLWSTIKFGGIGNPDAAFIGGTGFGVRSGYYYGIASGASPDNPATIDVKLFRDGPGVFGHRNGTSAQRFNTYNTWTSSTSWEAFVVDWQTTANVVRVGSDKGSGGGSTRKVAFVVGGANVFELNTNTDINYTGTGNINLVNAGLFMNSAINWAGGATTFNEDGAGVLKSSGAFKTANPASGTAAPWKFGSRVAATVALDTTQYIQLDVGGTLYKVAVVTE